MSVKYDQKNLNFVQTSTKYNLLKLLESLFSMLSLRKDPEQILKKNIEKTF